MSTKTIREHVPFFDSRNAVTRLSMSDIPFSACNCFRTPNVTELSYNVLYASIVILISSRTRLLVEKWRKKEWIVRQRVRRWRWTQQQQNKNIKQLNGPLNWKLRVVYIYISPPIWWNFKAFWELFKITNYKKFEIIQI